MRLSKLREIVKDKEAWRAAIHGITNVVPERGNGAWKTIICHFCSQYASDVSTTKIQSFNNWKIKMKMKG